MTSNDIMSALCEVFDTLTEEQQSLVMESITTRVYKKGEAIYHIGDMPVHMMCLFAGKVKIVKEGLGERQQIVRVLRPVSYFGYRASFAAQHFATAAVAIESSTVGFIPLRIIMRILKENQRLAWFFIRQLSYYLGLADERTLNLTQKHIRGRLAETLLSLKDCYGLEEDGCTLSIYLSREDLANMSNMTTSNAIRTLSAFAKEGIVAVDGRKIKIMQEQTLQAISRFG